MKLHTKQQSADSNRRGSLLIEAVVGALILGVAMAMLVPGLTGVRRQRQALRFETLALVELNNIAEFLPKPNLPVIAAGVVAANEAPFEKPPELSSWFMSRYANAQLEADILPAAGGNATNGIRGIRLTIHQPAFAAQPDQKVSVVVWQKSRETTP